MNARPPYDYIAGDMWSSAETFDPHYWIKLQRARDYLGPRCRAMPGCTHRYTTSNGVSVADADVSPASEAGNG